MNWPPDVPNVNLKKPRELEDLEQLEPHIREAMTKQEIRDHIDTIAQGFANDYKKKKESTYEDCIGMVELALNLSGGAIGGKVGMEMMGTSSGTAETACRIVFNNPRESN